MADKARSSVVLAVHAGGPTRVSASSAFVDGIHTGLLYAAGAAVVAAISIAVLLSPALRLRRAARPDQPELVAATS